MRRLAKEAIVSLQSIFETKKPDSGKQVGLFLKLAGALGFEPRNGGIKIR